MTAIIIQPTQTKTQSAVNTFAEKLQAGERLTQDRVIDVMSNIFGDASNGKWHWKSATDLVEASFVKILLSSDFKSLEAVQELQSLVPHHSARSQEQIQYQQFSTPLSLAWIVAQLAGIQKSDILLEPSAGTGILAAMVINRLFYGEPENVILNEISPARKALLREIFNPKYSVFNQNAEYINDVLPQPKQPSERPTVVVMNPPFSSAIGNDKRDREACMRHLRSALLRLADHGRLVGIFPHWLSTEKQPKFFASLPAQLRLSLYIGGEHYRFHGTNMETRILVFDKVPQAEMPKSIERDKFTAEQLSKVAAVNCPNRIAIAQQLAPVQAAVEIPALPLFAGLPLFQFAPSQELEISYTPVKSERKVASIASPVIAIEPKQQFTNLVQLQYRKAAKASEVMSDGSYSAYQCDISIEGATPHPTAICESVSMAAIESPLPTVHPTLPERVITEALASDCQLETLVYACQAHSVMLDTPWMIAPNGQIAVTNPDNPDGKYHRQGYYCGHNTGLGKSRIIALLMLTNWCEGRKKAVWVTKNNALFEDAQAEWMAVGGNKNQLISLSKIAQDKPILMTEGILFVTYGTLRSAATGNKQSRVDQIIQWLGDDWDGSMCFDEAHFMGNAAGEESDRGSTKASAQALAGTNLVNRLPNARVTYLSATAAEKVSSLSYCQRLGLWQTAAFPFSSRADFISSIEHAGVAGLEMVATDLKAVGLYLSPSLSFDGVSFETLIHEITPEQRQAWDIYAQAFRYIHAGLGEVLRSINLETQTGSCTNGRAKAAAIGIFESVKLRFFNALICAAKAPTLISAIEQDMADGYASVVQLVSTGAASMDRLLTEIPASEWDNLRSMDFSPKEGIIEYLLTSFPIHIYQITQDEHGNTQSKLMTDMYGEPIVSQEALIKRDLLVERMAILPPVNGLLDALNWHFGDSAVSEVTGRSKRIVLRDGKYQLAKRSSKSNVAEASAFMNDETRILVFSKSGGTGRSYHAAEQVKNQRLRRHYLLESGFSAKDAIQGLGRSHRSGQVQPPQIILITTNVRGELRFTSTISSRLAALGAITRGQRDTGCNAGLFDEATNNFASQYATSALGEFFADLRRGTVDGISLAEFIEYTGLRLVTENGQLLESLPKMNTFLNRLLALPIGLQNMLFADFEERINQRVAEAKANDSYDRGVENLFADGGFDVISTQVLNTHSSGAETICHTIDKLDRPSVVSVADAKRIVANQQLSTYRQPKTGKLAIAGFLDTRVSREGGIINVLIVYEPTATGTSWRKVDELDFLKSWITQTATTQYWDRWQQLVDLSPEFIRERMFLISGLLLPVWKKLPKENPKVVRLQTNSGDILLGRSIDKNKIQLVYEKFGLNNNVKLTTEEIYDLVWNQRLVKAVGNWNINKFYYKGTYYLEVLEVYSTDKIDRLKAIGCFTEMIKFRVKVFIPLDNAIEIMDKLMSL